jgi:hypothetical protein
MQNECIIQVGHRYFCLKFDGSAVADCKYAMEEVASTQTPLADSL